MSGAADLRETFTEQHDVALNVAGMAAPAVSPSGMVRTAKALPGRARTFWGRIKDVFWAAESDSRSFTQRVRDIFPAKAVAAEAGAAEATAAVGAAEGAAAKTMGQRMLSGVFGKGNIVSNVIGTGLTVMSANNSSKKSRRELILQYRNEIAAVTGTKPEDVGFDDLRKAAKKNAGLKQVLDVIEGQKNSTIRTGVGTLLLSTLVIGIVTGIPTGGMGFLATLAVGIPISLAAGFATGKADKAIFGTNDVGKTGHALVQQLIAKQQAGERVTVQDVFMTKLAMNPKAAKTIEKKYKGAFETLDAATQQKIMTQDFAKMGEASAMMANNINLGSRAEGVMVGVVKKPPTMSPELASIRSQMQGAGVSGGVDTSAIQQNSRDPRSFVDQVRSR